MVSEKDRSPVEIWRKKVDYLQQQEAITANPAQKFELQNQIEECNQKIKGYEENGTPASILPNKDKVDRQYNQVIQSPKNERAVSNLNIVKADDSSDIFNWNHLKKTGKLSLEAIFQS